MVTDLPAKKVSGCPASLRSSDAALTASDLKSGRTQVKTNGHFTTYMQASQYYLKQCKSPTLVVCFFVFV